MEMMYMKPVVFCILDGVGFREEIHGNAVKQANMKTFNRLLSEYPHSLLEASGELVGLPAGQMGNSEVGHMNIGAGRIVYQPLQLINEKIKDETFFENIELKKVMNHTKEQNSRLHIFGLVSDGGIHSTIKHLFALLEMCKKEDVKEVYLHLFTDGRDTLPDVAVTYLKQVEETCKSLHLGTLATLSGRYYAMDRDNRWDRVEKAYRAIVYGEGKTDLTYEQVIQASYEQKKLDEFILPTVFNENGMVFENDAMILFNFRPDRARELFKALTNPAFSEFEHKEFHNVPLVTMMPVSDEVLSVPAFKLPDLTNTLGEYISSLGKKQLRIAETEKYAHVTYFFDGGIEKELPNCKRVLIPSPKVATYDLQPEMSAVEITDQLLNELDNDYDLVVLNFANGDMVGHTGDMKATIKALETVDQCLERIEEKVKQLNGVLVVTADHGNSDVMLDEEEHVITSHSTSKVPFIVTKKDITLLDGKLGDIAPTLLTLMDLPIPNEMTGESRIQDRGLPRQRPIKKESKTSKKEWIFIVLSMVSFLVFCGFYGYRFFHYRYLELHPAIEDHTLATKLLDAEHLKVGNLIKDEKEYRYTGSVSNNYVRYSGMLFRIVKIGEDHKIQLVSQDAVTSLVWDGSANDYLKANIRSYLNPTDDLNSGILYKNLSSPETYLTTSESCIGVVKDGKKKCEDVVKDPITLLTYYDYIAAGGNDGFLNNNRYFWLLNASADGVWYVFGEGGAKSKTSGSDQSLYGIRPVLYLNSSVTWKSGTGTETDPYVIEDPTGSSLSQKNVGDYVTYSDMLFRILAKNDEGVKLLKEEPISSKGELVKKEFSKKSSLYNPAESNSIAYYLNSTFYNTLKRKDYLVKGTWFRGTYNKETGFDYKEIYQNPIKAYIGLPSVGEIAFHKDSLVTMTRVADKFVYSIKSNASGYTLALDEETSIYPALYLKKELQVTGGDGTKDNPYTI